MYVIVVVVISATERDYLEESGGWHFSLSLASGWL